MRSKLDINTHIHYMYIHCGLCRYSTATKHSLDEPLRPAPQRAAFRNYHGHRRVRDCITAAAAGYHHNQDTFCLVDRWFHRTVFRLSTIKLHCFHVVHRTWLKHVIFDQPNMWQRLQDVWRRLDLSNFCSDRCRYWQLSGRWISWNLQLHHGCDGR